VKILLGCLGNYHLSSKDAYRAEDRVIRKALQPPTPGQGMRLESWRHGSAMQCSASAAVPSGRVGMPQLGTLSALDGGHQKHCVMRRSRKMGPSRERRGKGGVKQGSRRSGRS
jgi:hypothetical protein